MKHIVLLFCLCIAGLANAGNKPSNQVLFDTITFYGVDFSLAKVYAADESAEQFLKAFKGINELFQSEPKKYDIAKAFKVKCTNTSLSQVFTSISKIDAANLFIQNDKYRLTQADVNKLISELDTGTDKGIGTIIIAGLLNKSTQKATYVVVTFNIGTKEIISQKQIQGKAKGFGLRNFWAGSVHSTLKQIPKA